MAVFGQLTDDLPLAISRVCPCSPSNPGGCSSEFANSVETLGESSPTAPVRDLVVQSLALSSPNRDARPSAPSETSDQLRNPSGFSSSSSLEARADRSLPPSLVRSENTEGWGSQLIPVAQVLPANDHERDNHHKIESCSNSLDDDEDAPGGWWSSSSAENHPARAYLALRDGEVGDDLKLETFRMGRGTWSSSWSGPEPKPRKPTGVGAGLWNLGNTCFINSVLQCFTHTMPLIEILRSYSHPMPCNCGSEGFCVIRVLRDHIEFALRSSGDNISPLQFVDNLNYFSSYFQRYHQEDAHEFLQSFLDKLERCCLKPKEKTGCVSSQDVNIVDQVFGGRLVSRLRCCICNSSSDTYEPSLGLSLEIEDVDNLRSALESFTCVEKLEDQFTCVNCIGKVSKEKQLMLDKAPLVATFHLKRFKNDGISMEKIHKHVDFPLELDLRPYMVDSQNNEASLTYHLYAFVEHLGATVTSGHYSSYVRSAPNTWHKFDDSEVTRIEEGCVLSQDAYILFYAREGTPWFSGVFEQIKPLLGVSTSNSSPKSVLDPAYGDCISDQSDENIDNSRLSKPGSLVEVPISGFMANSSKDLTDGTTAFRCHETKPDAFCPMDFNENNAPMTDAFEPTEADDIDKPCTLSSDSSQEDLDLCLAGNETAIADAFAPELGVQNQDRSGRHKEGIFRIQRGHLKTEKNQEETRKKPSGSKVADSRDKSIALRYLKKQPSSRARMLAYAMEAPFARSPTKRIKRVGKAHTLKRAIALNRPRPHRH